MKFKAGDKVVCIDSTGSDGLGQGRMYIVHAINNQNSCVYLEGIDLYYYLYRFRLATKEEIGARESKKEVDTTNASPYNLIPDCLAASFVGTSLIKEVVTMALKWQSEQPHVDGCNEGQPVWYMGSIADDLLYCNGKQVGTLDPGYAQSILDTLNAPEKPGPYCPACEALKELKK